jgi:hypothetical protein
MKKIICLFSFILLCSCNNSLINKNDIPAKQKLNIHFMEGFYNNESAVVFLDGNFLLSFDSLRTNPLTGFAYKKEVLLAPGKYTFTVSIPKYSIKADTAISIKEHELYLGVNYDRKMKKLSFKISERGWGYGSLNRNSIRSLVFDSSVSRGGWKSVAF